MRLMFSAVIGTRVKDLIFGEAYTVGLGAEDIFLKVDLHLTVIHLCSFNTGNAALIRTVCCLRGEIEPPI